MLTIYKRVQLRSGEVWGGNMVTLIARHGEPPCTAGAIQERGGKKQLWIRMRERWFSSSSGWPQPFISPPHTHVGGNCPVVTDGHNFPLHPSPKLLHSHSTHQKIKFQPLPPKKSQRCQKFAVAEHFTSAWLIHYYNVVLQRMGSEKNCLLQQSFTTKPPPPPLSVVENFLKFKY